MIKAKLIQLHNRASGLEGDVQIFKVYPRKREGGAV